MLKIIFITILTFFGLNLYSQDECKIIIYHVSDSSISFNDTTLCYNSQLFLYTGTSDSLHFSWEPNGENGASTEKFFLKDTTTYILHGYNDDSTFHCTDTMTLSIYPRIIIEFEQLQYGCPPADSLKGDTICKARVRATGTGGFPPIHYYWGDSVLVNYGDSALALKLCVNQSYTLKFYDTVCVYYETFDVEPFEMPDLIITVEPDSLFITNPQAKLSFENKSADSIPLTSWSWIFPDGSSTNQINPSYVFTLNDSLVKFTYTTIDNCNDTVFIPISVQEFELTVYNVFTPNGDGVNDKYEIPYLDRYISSHLYVFNRWGEMVYEKDNYNGEWDGGRLPDGVYFYVLKCQGYWKEDVFRGSVSIYGSKY